LADQFSHAYDTYLEIQRRVQSMINTALGHDTPHYRLLNVCPACFYQLADEPQLEYSFFCSCDGNNSLKRMGAWMHRMIARTDTRALKSDRWLSSKEVDRFKDEVKRRKVCFI
jgi:hypothetical protein